MNYKDNDMSSPLFREALHWKDGRPMQNGWYTHIGSSEYKVHVRDSADELWFHLVDPNIDVRFSELPECWRMESPVVTLKDDSEGHLRADICAMPTWEDFDKLIHMLKSEYGVKVAEVFDGPGTRIGKLHVDEKEFMLIHSDPYSNEFVATSDESREFVKKVGIDLGRRLKEQGGKGI